MEEADSQLSQIDRARLFWSTQDVDSVFSEILVHLNLLQTRLKTEPASDKDLVQSLKLLEAFDWLSVTPPSVVQVVIGSAPLSPGHPAPPVYQEHCCGKSCVPTLPSIPQSVLWALNPLQIPLVYGFYRSSQSERGREQTDPSESGVLYLAPCGRRLSDPDAVMDFLLQTQSFHHLQLDLFSFNPCVSVELFSPSLLSRPVSGPDLSRGQELVPVELCVSDGERPPVFRYRRERWPRGCFLSRPHHLYSAFCDCRGHCGDCACAGLNAGGGYEHQRLRAPKHPGIFECGPWCGCDPGLCQNRVVQRGLRVRLQVYRTRACPDQGPDQKQEVDQRPDQKPEQGWGVRCKDDLDKGTFICIYAGVVLQKSDGQLEAPPLKQRRAELASDDEVQLVTEWLPSPLTPPPSTDSAHVPVIQRGSDVTGQEQTAPPFGLTGAEQTTVNDLYLIDASKEGNVSRFFNHSCDPTLFVQNVFTDSHDKKFPNISFFTKRALKAGTELTWDYNSALSQEVNSAAREMETGVQEVPCLCRSGACRERFYVTEMKNPTKLTHPHCPFVLK
ncbi:histone-lysine N-methyltransferase SETDB2 isoform X2 [Periophthalmus magnuspinnatus]|uniref:histone-lysine N-methyltransferase SETDB2 isoform X2 n=1 Tax=Periophthalmus magnuspinnatus TaxID=409849 RepID=UPI002436949E|nr:histone-lysine N-methyltransferase SETDB2 isoform X2 [Periophthalmus magnuspinnatus]